MARYLIPLDEGSIVMSEQQSAELCSYSPQGLPTICDELAIKLSNVRS